MFDLPQNVLKIINTIETAGYEAWCVGGCVRDMLLGTEPKDYDIASSAPCEEVIRLFENTVPTGLKHGTVTVVLNKIPYEVTRYRIDGDYTDMRRPDSVAFTGKFADDLARRDFTVNAMGYHPKRGIFDPFGGRDDLANGVLKTVGDPKKRFSEDALRILRAVRFKSVLDFAVDPATAAAAVLLAPSLNRISAERVFCETEKALGGCHPSELSLLINAGGFEAFGLHKVKKPQLLDKTEPIPMLRLALLCVLADAKHESVYTSLRCSNKGKKECAAFYTLLSSEKLYLAECKRQLSTLGYKGVKASVSAFDIFRGSDSTEIIQALNEAEKIGAAHCIKMLKIDGNKLKEIGISGKETGEMLNALLDIVLDNPAFNDEKLLFSEAKRIKTNKTV